MQYALLGGTGLTVSRIGFGCRAIGGEYGPADESTSRAALIRALDLGVTLFETAPEYGAGRVEELLRDVLPNDPTASVIALQVDARLLEAGDKGMREAIGASLARLRRGAIDLVVLRGLSGETLASPSSLAPLETLRSEGLVRAIGASFLYEEDTLAAIAQGRVGALEFPYHVLSPMPGQMLFGIAPQRGIGLIAREVLGNGLLTGSYALDAFFPDDDVRSRFRHDTLRIRARVAQELSFLRSEWRRTLAQAFIRYALDAPGVNAALVGCRTPRQVEENVGALEVPPLTANDYRRIQEALNRLAHVHF